MGWGIGFFSGAGMGAALMYLLDRDLGRERRQRAALALHQTASHLEGLFQALRREKGQSATGQPEPAEASAAPVEAVQEPLVSRIQNGRVILTDTITARE